MVIGQKTNLKGNNKNIDIIEYLYFFIGYVGS